ncbi:hypothetical protein XENOCAPTIV_000547 [Xenoophorus captivus]|uniref:Uncharacterized protein n=1 Tax=Xenoophorus captivus TaxID=1517983 RepID=A0ABV0RWF0_9TELE
MSKRFPGDEMREVRSSICELKGTSVIANLSSCKGSAFSRPGQTVQQRHIRLLQWPRLSLPGCARRKACDAVQAFFSRPQGKSASIRAYYTLYMKECWILEQQIIT